MTTRIAGRFVALLVLLSSVAACGGMSRSFGGGARCERRASAEPSAPAAKVDHTQAHPDYAALRAFRSYTAVDRVDPYAHHFTVWYDCVEQSVRRYAVTEAPGTGELHVRVEGGGWGGLAYRPKKIRKTPKALARMEQAVLAELDAELDGYARPAVGYYGAYSTVHVSEIVPLSVPGDPFRRMIVHTQVALRADADLQAVVGDPASMTGGLTRMCWDNGYRSCVGAKRWIDFVPDIHDGTPRLTRWTYEAAGATDARRRFLHAALAAARDEVAGAPRPALDALAVHESDALLPEGFAQSIRVGFDLYARPKDHAKTEQVSARPRAELAIADAARGAAEGTAAVELAGRTITVRAALSADEPLPAGATGEHTAAMTLDVWLDDGAGAERHATFPVEGTLLVDGARVAILTLGIAERAFEGTGHHDPPRNQQLPGAGAFSQIDAYVATETNVRWMP